MPGASNPRPGFTDENDAISGTESLIPAGSRSWVCGTVQRHLGGALGTENGRFTATAEVTANQTFTLGGVNDSSDPTNPVTGRGEIDFNRAANDHGGTGNLISRQQGKHERHGIATRAGSSRTNRRSVQVFILCRRLRLLRWRNRPSFRPEDMIDKVSHETGGDQDHAEGERTHPQN